MMCVCASVDMCLCVNVLVTYTALEGTTGRLKLTNQQ